VTDDGTIVLEDEHAIDHPDDIAHMLVNAGAPPMRLAVEQENLEEYFLRLTNDMPLRTISDNSEGEIASSPREGSSQ
jgi:hypothetical protein